MKTVQRHLVSLDKYEFVNSCINSKLFFPINHYIEINYCKIDYEKFTQDLLEFINLCCNLQLINDPIDEKKIIFLHQTFDSCIKFSLVYEQDLINNKIKTREYPIYGLNINEVLNIYVANTPFTLNNIKDLMIRLIYYMWMIELSDSFDFSFTNEIPNNNYHLLKMNINKSLNQSQCKLRKEVWESKYNFDKCMYQSELIKILDTIQK